MCIEWEFKGIVVKYFQENTVKTIINAAMVLKYLYRFILINR